MNKYRKKPVVIKAAKWDERKATLDLLIAHGLCWTRHDGHVDAPDVCRNLGIRTLEGTMRAEVGDWIIKGVAGEFYTCKPDIFEKSYEPADERPQDWSAGMEQAAKMADRAALTALDGMEGADHDDFIAQEAIYVYMQTFAEAIRTKIKEGATTDGK